MLSIYLLNFTECNQLLKIPVFFAHLHEHRMEDPHISIITFIKLHYFSGNIHDKDYDRDMELPFKTHDYIGYAVMPAIAPPVSYTVTVPYSGDIRINYPSYLNKMRPVIPGADIWQPPRTFTAA